MNLRATALSDLGKVRRTNEDAFSVHLDRRLFIVSDGMGGRHAGATASNIVVEVLPRMIHKRIDSLRKSSTKGISLALRNTIVNLSKKIRNQSAGQPGLAGMGATVVLVYLRDDVAFFAHMGDSRAYLYRGKQLKQLTEDHSIVGILLKDGEITPEEARDHAVRGMLSRYVGMERIVYPDVTTAELTNDDRILLCTDGLTCMVSDEAIARILSDYKLPEQACKSLVDAANENGGKDNITVLLIDCYRTEGLNG